MEHSKAKQSGTVKGEDWCLQGRSCQNDNFPDGLLVCDPSQIHGPTDVVNSCGGELVDEHVVVDAVPDTSSDDPTTC